jgi:hypothetical protein
MVTGFASSATAIERAQACGGLFCSGGGQTSTSTVFVNQTAERIVFVDNPDGTVTAIIQIVYEGPADRFAWLLPVPGVPDVAVSSTVVLDALQQATNPQYQVSTMRQFCGPPSGFAPPSCPCGGCAFAPGAASPSNATADVPVVQSPVVVEASGTIGPYDYTVISVQGFVFDPATAAIDWLESNEFDVGELGPDVLRPYLQDGLNLLAFRLNKDADVGSIRPVMLTYASEQPSIPLRPTAVAAEDDMGVLVWVFAPGRTVPTTYKTVELNEALINWFDPASNYGEVVSQAADEAGGQAFATEFAGPLANAATLVSTAGWAEVTPGEQDTWLTIATNADRVFGTWEGFDEALAASLALPEGVAFTDLRACLPALRTALETGAEASAECVQFTTQPLAGEITLDFAEFDEQMHEFVIDPVTDTLAAIGSQPYVTRLYTTLSPDEMTVDPTFDVNPSLPIVSNLHGTMRTIPCSSNLGSMMLPQGATIVTDATSNEWPVEMTDLPAALLVIQHGTSGGGQVLVDERARVQGATFGLGACRMSPGTTPGGEHVLGGSGGAGGGEGPAGGGAGRGAQPGERSFAADESGADWDDDGLCAVRAPGASERFGGGWLALAALAWLARRRTHVRTRPSV